MAKSTWNGTLVIGLINMPVSLFTSVRDEHIGFKQLCPIHHKPISQRRFCPGEAVAADEVEGRPAKPPVTHEVAYGDLVFGYTLDEKTAVFTKDELERAPVPKNFEITLFVPENNIDPRFYEKPYVVGPRDASADRPYALVREALRRTGMVGIGKIAISSRERLAGLRCVDGLLILQIMRWPAELVNLSDFADYASLGADLLDREVSFGEQLVHELSGSFADADFRDEHQKMIEEMVEAKLNGEEPPRAPLPEPETSGVADLLSVLQASLDARRAA
jgi:DNA end-binding protein Ku